jgi:hypothetical protein
MNMPVSVYIYVTEYWDDNQNGQSRETSNIEYTRRGKAKQKHNAKCVGHHYAQTNTHIVNKI